MQNEFKFRLSLRRAARLGLITGKISANDWLTVQGVLLHPHRKTPEGVEVDLLEEIAQDALEALQSDQKIAATETIESVDWNAILDFFQNFFPVVMDFINSLLKLFNPVATEGQPQ